MIYGLIMALVASMTKSSQYLMEKKTLFEYSPLEISWANRFLSTMFLGTLLGISGFTVPAVAWYFWPVLFICSGIYVFTTWLMRQSVKSDDTSEIFPLLSIQPLFVVPTSYLILGELPSTQGMIGILLLVSGVYLLNMKWNQKSVYGPFLELWRDPDDLRIIFVVLLFAVSAPLSKIGIRQTSPLVWTLLIHIFIAVVFTIWLFVRKTQEAFLNCVLRPHWSWIAIAFFSATTVLLRNVAIKWTLVAYVASIMQTSVFFTVLIGGLYFNESALRKRFVACLLVIVGNVIVMLAGIY